MEPDFGRDGRYDPPACIMNWSAKRVSFYCAATHDDLTSKSSIPEIDAAGSEIGNSIWSSASIPTAWLVGSGDLCSFD